MSQPFATFGLDLSGTNARTVLLRSAGKNYTVRSYTQSIDQLPQGKNGVVDPATLGPWLLSSMHSLGAHLPKHVNIAVPDELCFVFTVTLKKENASDLAEAVRWEAGQHLPYDLDQLVFDWQVLAENNGNVTIQVVAMQKETAENYCTSVEQAGLIPVSLIPASVAGTNVFSEHIPTDTPALFLLLKSDITVLSLLGNGGIALSVSGPTFSGARIRSLLRDKLQLSEPEVEKTLELCENDPIISKGILQDTLTQELRDLALWTQSIAASAGQFSFSNPTTLFLAGEHSTMQSLDQELHTQTKLTVTRPDPINSLRVKKRKSAQQNVLTEYCTALGAALHQLS